MKPMKVAIRALISLICGACIVYVLAALTPERFEPALYWSLPLFHKVFPPWVAGPNPEAAGCALLTNTLLLATVAFLLLSRKRHTP